MNLKDDGLQFWQPGDGLVMLVIVDDGPDPGSKTVETINNPSRVDIANASWKYGFDFEEMMETIDLNRTEAHSLFIDMAIYREAQK